MGRLLLVSLTLLPLVASAQNAGYDKGFFIRSTDQAYSLEANARIQLRGAWEAIDSGTDDLDHRGAFSIPRARLKLGGNLFGKELTYTLQIEFGGGFVHLRDAYMDYAVIPSTLHVRAGQWKRPFSRQQITSSGKLEFVDRARTDKDFGAGRDLGVALSNDYERSPVFEWVVGVFNGTGDKPVFSGTVDGEEVSGGKFTNVPTELHPMVVARFGWNYGGIKGYSEADLEGGAPRVALGLSGIADFDVEHEKSSAFLGEFDALFKAHGFSASAAVYVASKQDGEGAMDQSFARLGFHAQVGYVVAKRFQPALRVAMFMPDGDDNDVLEALGGFSFYFWGHDAKLQLDGGVISRDTASDALLDGTLRAQLQVGF